tara:strand:- start:376 stop:1242 length:867 start_codon:yes stop_codon:yes gene_type:complete
MNKIPVVIIHEGYKEYLKINLEITGKNNKIYLIGDKSVKCLERLHNVTFVDINKYRNHSQIKNLHKHFINYSSNNPYFEWICFQRVFILELFMKGFNISSLFHVDSDNILLHDINTYKFTKNIAYCCCKNYHTHRMSNSIHCGLLNIEFCKEFKQLYTDIYVNKSKYNLIEDKIKFHSGSNGTYINGGICDMTLYYLLANEKLCDVQNLLNLNNGYVFVNNINNGEGDLAKEQYLLENNIIKVSKNTTTKKNLIYDKIKNKEVDIFNIHFQGGAKMLLNENLKNYIIY